MSKTKENWPFIPSSNLAISGAQGLHLHTQDGRSILDAAGGAIVANVGWGRESVVEAIAQATRAYTYVVPPWKTPSREALAETLLNHWLPTELPHIHITSGGSEANESALKLALQYQYAIGQPARHKIISRHISYHGTTLSTAGLSGHPARKLGISQGIAENPTAPTPYSLRCPLGAFHDDAANYYIGELKKLIEREGPGTIAALIAEPIVGSSGGALVPPKDYWPGVRKLCNEYGILLIFDEVMTGFGRTGVDFAYQHWDCMPDILVAGKGLAGGYAPLGGLFASTQIAQAIKDSKLSVMFHTFGAHPAACAAAVEVLRILKDENLVERCEMMGNLLQAKLEQAFQDHPHVGEVRGAGLLRAVEIVADKPSLGLFPAKSNITNSVIGQALRNNVFFYNGGTGEVRDIICMGPAYTVTESHIDTMVDTLKKAVDSVTSANRSR